MNRDKLTLQEHVYLGNCLRVALDKLTTKVSNIKPKNIARVSKEGKAIKLINELRSSLEDIMFQDYGEECDRKFSKSTWWQDIYYGNAGRRKNE
ncbi:MAG: hypothetical protein ABH879_04040 [archaeon]